MIPESVINSLQQEITQERINHLLYKSFSKQLKILRWKGSAHFFKKQAEEEKCHSHKFANYLTKNGIMPIYAPVPSPEVIDAPDLLPYFEKALQAEMFTSNLISEMHKLADDEYDFVTGLLLDWFVQEQQDSENLFRNIIVELQRAADDIAALIIEDKKIRKY